MLIELLCCLAFAQTAVQDEPPPFIHDGEGRTVAETIAGMEWDEISTDYIPGVDRVDVRVEGSQNYRWVKYTFIWEGDTQISVTATAGENGATIGLCLPWETFIYPFASFCRSGPYFRTAALTLIGLGYTEITFLGKTATYTLDLDEIELSRQEIETWLDEATAANPDNSWDE